MRKIWEILYTDGSRFSNLDGAWEDAPRGWAQWDERGSFGVFKVCVKKDFDPNTIYFFIVEGYDWYKLDEANKTVVGGTVVKHDSVGISTEIQYEDPAIKYGRMVNDPVWMNQLIQWNILDYRD